MIVWWLGILLIYGGINGYATIPTLMWWLLLVFVVQDVYDLLHTKRK